MTSRYAIYFAPARLSPWWDFGARWLGRDDATGEALPPGEPGSAFGPLALAALTAQPRRYGFHATLKAPMRIACREDEFVRRVDALARAIRPVPVGPLQPALLDDFVALVPRSAPPALGELAARCVVELDDLRAPLTAAERDRRRPTALDRRQRELLERYGYPHVLERFRFHMTLTGPVDGATAALVIARTAPEAERLHRESPLALDRLCVFREPSPGAALLRVHDARLGA